ncbi:MAG TPA: glycosyltransferase family 2 protein [Chitinophagaceae bacterium]|nr:glycosyltransferase family 2 protein [Chitinophagaceae bacterium]
MFNNLFLKANYNLMAPELSLVIPLYNEEEVFDMLKTRLIQVLDSADISMEIVLVNDGSSDKTAQLIKNLTLHDNRFVGLSLSRNFGHQLALSAGLQHASGTNAIMILDGDLQDPPELWKPFYEKIKEGYDVVYAIRANRKEGFFLKMAYRIYYRVMKHVANLKIPIDAGDFCMISRRVNNLMISFPEESRYMRGIRTWIGFKQTGFPYSRDERKAGTSKYTLRKLIQLAYLGFFNFSDFPIKLIKRIGYLGIALAFGYLLYSVYLKFFAHEDVPRGFNGILFAVVMLGSIQFIAIGLIGEYLVRVFFQTKGRPLFLIDWVVKNSSLKKYAYEPEPNEKHTAKMKKPIHSDM